MKVGEICTRSVPTIQPEDTVSEAARRMRNGAWRGSVVTDGLQHPIGMLTDRDIVVRGVAQHAGRMAALLVSEAMSRDVSTCFADETVDAALCGCGRSASGRLPVVDADGFLTGLVTLNDVLALMSEELRDVIGLVGRELQRDQAPSRGVHRFVHTGARFSRTSGRTLGSLSGIWSSAVRAGTSPRSAISIKRIDNRRQN